MTPSWTELNFENDQLKITIEALRREVGNWKVECGHAEALAAKCMAELAAMTLELQKRDKCSYMGPMRDCPTHGESEKLAAMTAERDEAEQDKLENYRRLTESRRSHAAMTAERDEERYKHEQAVTINERLLSDNRIAKEQLAASQAYSQQLREALEDIKSNAEQFPLDEDILRVISKAFALLQDDTALKAWGAKLLRDAAGRMSIASDYAVLFRMADELEQTK